MKNINKGYIIVCILFIPLISSCDRAVSEKQVLLEMINTLQEQHQQYFQVSFKISDSNNSERIHQLSGNASLKMGKNGSISKAFFTLEGGDKLHYLHSIMDNNTTIYLLESNELEADKVAQLNDSIISPILLHPSLILEWYDKASDIALTNNSDDGEIDIVFQLAQEKIKVSWDKKQQHINGLEVIDHTAHKYIWKFTYLSEEAFETVFAANELQFANQDKEFL